MKSLYSFDEIEGKMKPFPIETDDESTRVHPYYGEKISFNENKFDVEEISLPNYCEDFQTKVPQGAGLYDGLHFQFTTGGYCSVYDISNAVKLGEFALDGIVEGDAESSPHCNSVCFSNIFFVSSDEFPLLYVNAYNSANLPLGTCYVHRITRDGQNNFTTELIQTINIGFAVKENDGLWADFSDKRPYGNFVIDTDKGHLYAYTLRDGLRVTRFFKFKLPNIQDGDGNVVKNVTLSESDIIDKFDCEYFPIIQDSKYFQGKIYLCTGNTSVLENDPSIRVIDLTKREQVTHIKLLDLDISAWRREPESIVIYENSILMTSIAKLSEPPKTHRFYF